MLSPDLDAVGPKNAARIWGFISKFAILDRFSKTLGVEKVYPALPVPKTHCGLDYIGTASKVNNFLLTLPFLLYPYLRF